MNLVTIYTKGECIKMEKKKLRVARISVEDIQEVKVSFKDDTFITLYRRKDDGSNLFELIFYDEYEEVCAICGGNEDVDHTKCVDFTTFNEETLIEAITDAFNNGGIIEINNSEHNRFIKRV